jgi:hypothetical protein
MNRYFSPRQFSLLALFCLAGTRLLQAEPAIGMTQEELIADKGKPLSKITVGAKSVFRWADMDVTLQNREVVLIKVRDLEAEKRDEEKRLRAIEEANARQAAWLATRPKESTNEPQTFSNYKSQLDIAKERANRAQQILTLKQNIEGQRGVIARYSTDFTTPTANHDGSITAAQRDLAQALITQYELEVEELERQQLRADMR